MKTIESVVSGKRKRGPAVSQAAFVAAVKAGSDASPKLTGGQVAEKLGMEKASFDQRLNQIRMNWRAYMVVILLKQHALLSEVNKVTGANYTQPKLDELVAGLKADGTWDQTEIHDDFLAEDDIVVAGKRNPKPFPFTFADGRGEGNGGGGRKVQSTRNAIFNAMMNIDGKGESDESNNSKDETDKTGEDKEDNAE